MNGMQMVLPVGSFPKTSFNPHENRIDSLMSLLARVLREEARKSTELTTGIINIFFDISNFANYHQILIQNKVGDACLKILDQEITRCRLWCEQLDAIRSKGIRFQ